MFFMAHSLSCVNKTLGNVDLFTFYLTKAGTAKRCGFGQGTSEARQPELIQSG